MSHFICSLYSRTYVGNQFVVRKGDKFNEMYMIEKGTVLLSLSTKWHHEYFQLPKFTYFGDYQLILNYRSRECYCTNNKAANMMCIGRKVLLELLDKFPEVKQQFTERAKKRRIEFRRVILPQIISI